MVVVSNGGTSCSKATKRKQRHGNGRRNGNNGSENDRSTNGTVNAKANGRERNGATVGIRSGGENKEKDCHNRYIRRLSIVRERRKDTYSTTRKALCHNPDPQVECMGTIPTIDAGSTGIRETCVEDASKKNSTHFLCIIGARSYVTDHLHWKTKQHQQNVRKKLRIHNCLNITLRRETLFPITRCGVPQRCIGI